MLYRALIKTHHMTSRKKLAAIRQLAKQYKCVVYLKTGLRPPGVLVAERFWRVKEKGRIGEEEMGDGGGLEGDSLRDWVQGVKVRGWCLIWFVFWNGKFGGGVLV